MRRLPGFGGGWRPSVALTALTAVAWIIGNALGDLTDFSPTGMAAFYLPVGIVVAFLLHWRSHWLAIGIGVVVGNQVLAAVLGSGVWLPLVESVINAIEAVLVAALLVRMRATTFTHPRDAVSLGLAGAVGAGLGAVTGAAFLAEGANQAFGVVLQNWLAADLMGIVLVVPALTVVLRGPWSRRAAAGIAGLVIPIIPLAFVAAGLHPAAGDSLATLVTFLAWYALLVASLLAGVWFGVVGLGVLQIPAVLASFAAVESASAQEWLVRQILAVVLGLTMLLVVLLIRREIALREASESIARGMFDHTPVPTARVRLADGPQAPDGRLHLIEANAAFRGLIGLDDPDVVGTDVLRFFHPDDAADAGAVIRGSAGSLAQSRDLRITHRGSADPVTVRIAAVAIRRPDAEQAWHEVVVVFEDVTRQRQAERRLEQQARIDALTGVLNRRALADALTAALAEAAAGPGVGLLFIDLDDFKVVNDAHGHEAGDVVLRVTARRLSDTVRPRDLVGRYGGDEFVVLAHVDDQHDLDVLRERVESVLRAPIDIGDHEVRVGGSVGIALATAQEQVEDVLRRADADMYRRKADFHGRPAG